MIDNIIGILFDKDINSICVNVHGIVYKVEVPLNVLSCLPRIGEEIVIFTHLIIKEDSHVLYGFLEKKEREIFKLLIKVSGVGPRTALSILSKISLKELSKAIIFQESYKLVNIPGIGKKTAERLILELKEKFNDKFIDYNTNNSNNKKDILNALISLGYSENESIIAINKIQNDLNISESIKQALKILSG